MIIGHTRLGHGSEHVLVMHDWFCCTTSYAPLLDYLDTERFTYVFMDLRGYGKSKHLQGECTAEEASRDALALVDHLKWDTFHLVGHSMTGLVVQQITLDAPSRIKSVVAITPVPACGSPIPEDVMGFLEDAATANAESARGVIQMMSGNRYGDSFISFKVDQWRSTSEPQARVAYLRMFAETNIASQVTGLETPYCVIIGANDAEGHSLEVMNKTFKQYYPHCEIKTIQDAGHYPMQETPPLLATLIENFISTQS